MSASVVDSLQQIIHQQGALLAAKIAHPETVTVAVHDTVVRVASASLGGWAEFWRIVGQIFAAALALLGGWVIQRHFRIRDERRAAAVAARAFLQPVDRALVSFWAIVAKIGDTDRFPSKGPVVFRTDLETLRIALSDLFEAEKTRLFELGIDKLERSLVEARESAQELFDQLYKYAATWYPENQVGSQYKFGELPGFGSILGQFSLFADSIRTHQLKFESLARDLRRLLAAGESS